MKLSVIVPVYRAEETLRRCVESILRQTVSDLEILLVEDGSPDRSGALCDELAKADLRIRVFHKPNGGAASARNLGIDHARGEYIGFVDSDDYIAPEMYETLMSVMERENLRMLDSGRCNVIADRVTESPFTDRLTRKSAEEAIGALLDWTGNCSLCTRLFRAEVFSGGMRIPEGRRVEDFYFCIQLFDKLGGDAALDHSFYYVVHNPVSVTRSGGGSIFLDALYYADCTKALIEEKYPALAQKEAFFRFYCIGQLFLNANKQEYRAYRTEFKRYAAFLRGNIPAFLKNKRLSLKYRVILLTACVNYRIPALLYHKH